MSAHPRSTLRRTLTLAGFVGVVLGGVGCGERSAPPDAGSRGVWRYGVAEPDMTPLRREGSGTGAPAPAAAAKAPTPVTAPRPPAPPPSSAKPEAATPKPVAPPPPPSKAPPSKAPSFEPAGSYKVVEVKDGGSIHVVCRLTGAPAELETIPAFKHRDQGCTDHKTERCRYLKKGEGELRLGNCVVYLRPVKEGKDWPAALASEDRTFVMDQKACVYLPHVGWTRPGTQVVVINSDRADHNIHGNFGADTKFNFGSEPGTRKDSITEAFLETPGAYVVKCDIHPWMNAYVFLMPHPYVAITPEADGEGALAGEAVLDDVPAGTYELVCWHEGMESKPTELNGVINGYVYSADITLAEAVTVVAKGRHEVVFSVPYK